MNWFSKDDSFFKVAALYQTEVLHNSRARTRRKMSSLKNIISCVNRVRCLQHLLKTVNLTNIDNA